MKKIVRPQVLKQARHFFNRDKLEIARKDLEKVARKREKEVSVHKQSGEIIKREVSNKPLISEDKFFGK